MKYLFILLSYFSAIPYMASTQNALPNTDIFICDVSVKDGKYSFSNLKNITNREGYDNQPNFINNHTILYTSIREDKQADIYQYELETGKIIQITNKPEDEYSPALMPDGKHISTVRVEQDSTQRLWKFPLNNPDSFSLVLPDVKGVGYYCWSDYSSSIALFVLGNPYTLQLQGSVNDELLIIDSFVGRSLCLYLNPDEGGGDELTYVSKTDSNNWTINHYSNGHYGPNIYKIIDLPETSEDFVNCFGDFWIANGSKLLKTEYKKGKHVWKEVYDFKGTPAENFYRIAFSPDGKHLALVSYVGKKP